ncbi:MAG: HAMP domain-containing histidine kinase [Methylophilaceae bacterium]|nr:HAMP domain-containing histidine kinase [Methylophilaceae bacterium]
MHYGKWLDFSSRRWGLGVMLLTLHFWVVYDFGSHWTTVFTLVHYGAFLIWQPIWRGEQHLGWVSAILFVMGGGVLLLLQGWWLCTFWLAGLIGLLGGRVFSVHARYERVAHLVAVGYLLTLLLLWVEPHLLNLTDNVKDAQWIVQYLLPGVPLVLMFVRAQRVQAPAASIDFFYSLLLFLLTVILVMGSFIIATVTREDYAFVLMRVTFVIAAVLVALSWLWNPRAGFSGLGELFSRYLMSVGMPFEQWLQRIAMLAETTVSSSQFLHAAMQEIAQLPWVSGGVWQAETASGNFGVSSPYKASFSYHGLRLTLFARSVLSPALTLHIKLLTQLLGEFHVAKMREEQMRHQAYLRAVHETGARLTHDIKNLLQSLNTLCSAVEHASNTDHQQLVALIQRQLPQLAQRLRNTLDKLQAPQPEPSSSMNAITWWNQLRQRYRDAGITFTADKISAGSELPADLFDTVADNLLQNALEKRRTQLDLKISVALKTGDYFGLTVEDDGTPIPDEVAEKLFKVPLTSVSGLGIGLYQAARQAQQHGYRLELASNRRGAVRFELKKHEPTAQDATTSQP